MLCTTPHTESCRSREFRQSRASPKWRAVKQGTKRKWSLLRSQPALCMWPLPRIGLCWYPLREKRGLATNVRCNRVNPSVVPAKELHTKIVEVILALCNTFLRMLYFRKDCLQISASLQIATDVWIYRQTHLDLASIMFKELHVQIDVVVVLTSALGPNAIREVVLSHSV